MPRLSTLQVCDSEEGKAKAAAGLDLLALCFELDSAEHLQSNGENITPGGHHRIFQRAGGRQGAAVRHFRVCNALSGAVLCEFDCSPKLRTVKDVKEVVAKSTGTMSCSHRLFDSYERLLRDWKFVRDLQADEHDGTATLRLTTLSPQHADSGIIKEEFAVKRTGCVDLIAHCMNRCCRLGRENRQKGFSRSLLFDAVSVLDRYLMHVVESCKVVRPEDWVPLGVASLLVAASHHRVGALLTIEWLLSEIQMSTETYQKEDIIHAEIEILAGLNFVTKFPTSKDYLAVPKLTGELKEALSRHRTVDLLEIFLLCPQSLQLSAEHLPEAMLYHQLQSYLKMFEDEGPQVPRPQQHLMEDARRDLATLQSLLSPPRQEILKVLQGVFIHPDMLGLFCASTSHIGGASLYRGPMRIPQGLAEWAVWAAERPGLS